MWLRATDADVVLSFSPFLTRPPSINVIQLVNIRSCVRHCVRVWKLYHASSIHTLFCYVPLSLAHPPIVVDHDIEHTGGLFRLPSSIVVLQCSLYLLYRYVSCVGRSNTARHASRRVRPLTRGDFLVCHWRMDMYWEEALSHLLDEDVEKLAMCLLADTSSLF